jgi:MoxR-like ATPase
MHSCAVAFFITFIFHDRDTLQAIVAVHFPRLPADILRAALHAFLALRKAPGLKKKPSTSELLNWLQLLLAEQIDAASISAGD